MIKKLRMRIDRQHQLFSFLSHCFQRITLHVFCLKALYFLKNLEKIQNFPYCIYLSIYSLEHPGNCLFEKFLSLDLNKSNTRIKV